MLCANIAHAQTVGQGEYRFGPDTSENAACKIAMERAKENAIANFVGEQFELTKNEYCKNETCTTHSLAFSEVSGQIKKILKSDYQVAPERGHSVCVVDLIAEVEPIKNPIDAKFIDLDTELMHGDRFYVNVISNKVGKVYLFNFIDGDYTFLAESNAYETNKKVRLPTGALKFEATVPIGKKVSKELVVALFTTSDLTIRSKYSRIEFERLVNDLPFNGRKLIVHHLTIVR